MVRLGGREPYLHLFVELLGNPLLCFTALMVKLGFILRNGAATQDLGAKLSGF